MARFLASVADLDEAAVAAAAGADIIDLKNPRRGALGAWGIEGVRRAVAELGGERPMSATIGDLPMQPEILLDAAAAVGAAGVDYVKVGFFKGGDHERCAAALGRLRHRRVAVLMADQNPDLSLLETLAAAEWAGVMLDTADKAAGGLLAHISLSEISRFLALARAHGLFAGLAGSLRLADIGLLAAMGPDYLGFRGALCSGGRAGRLDPAACGAVRQAVGDAARSATATAGAQASTPPAA